MPLAAGDVLTYNGTEWVNQPSVQGPFGIGTTSPNVLLHVTADDANNDMKYGLKLVRTTSATPGVGLGTGIQFVGETASGGREIGVIQCVINNMTSLGSYLAFAIVMGGSTSEIMRLQAAGTAPGQAWVRGDLRHGGTNLGFYNTTPIAKQSVSGSRGGNAALADLLTKLANLGLITDSTTA